MAKLQTNTLYYGDNLEVLRDHIPDEYRALSEPDWAYATRVSA